MNCDTCGGTKRVKHERVNMEAYRKEEDFHEFYDDGDVVPLAEFLTRQGFEPDQIGNEAKQKRFVEEDWGDNVLK